MTNDIYCKSIRLNLVISSYSLLLINRLVSKKKTQETNNLNYFLYNSIAFNLYKKTLNKHNIAAIVKNKGKNENFKPNSLIVDLHKRYASFGKLTWYWLFRMMVNSRFLLNYKEFKNYFAKNTFLKYESSLLLYDKKYNLWKKQINTHMENVLPLHRYTSKKKRKVTGIRLYNFPTKIKKRKRAPKYGRLDSFIFSKKNKLNFKFMYKDRKRYKRRFGINHRCLIKNKLIRNLRFFLRKKHHRRYSLKPKKWALKKAKKNLFKRIRRKLKIRQINLRLIKNETGLSVGYFFAKSALRVKRAKNSLEKALWFLKIAKNTYFGNISKSFKRKRLNNNLLLFRNSKNNVNLFLKKNKKNIKKLFTSYLFPRNVIDMKEKSNFESIVFDKITSNIKDLDINTKNSTSNYKNLTTISEVKYSKLGGAITLKKNKNNVALVKGSALAKEKKDKNSNNFKPTILVEKKIQKNNFLKKNLKKKNVEFLDKIYFLKKTKVIANSSDRDIFNLKNHKAFINFFYKKKIKVLKAFNLKNLKIQNFRFMLNKKRLNTVITNIFMENFLIDYFYSNLCEKRASMYMRGSNSRYFKFILLLKKLYKKKQARKPYQNLVFKRKKKLKNFLKKKKRLKYFLKTNYKFLPGYQKKFKSLLNYLFPGSNKELKVNKLRIFRRISFWNNSTGCYNIRMRKGFRLKLRFKRFRKMLFWKKKIRALSFWSKLSKFRHKNISVDCPKLRRKAVLFDLKWKNLIQPLLQFEKTKILYSSKTYPKFFKKALNGNIGLKKKQICNLLGAVLKQKKIKLLITKPSLVVSLPIKKIYKKDKSVKKYLNFNKALKKILEKKTDKNKQKPVNSLIVDVNNIQDNKDIKKKINKNNWLLWKSNKKWSKKIIKNYGFRSWELYKKKIISKKKKTLNLVYRKLKKFTNKRGMSATFYKKNFIFKFLKFKLKNFKLKNSIKILKNKIGKNQELLYFSKLKIKKQFFFKMLKQRENSKIFKNRLKFFEVKKKKIIKKKLKLLKEINKSSNLKFLTIFFKKKIVQPSAKNFLYLKFLMKTTDKKILLLKGALQNYNLELLRFNRGAIKTQKNYNNLIKSLRLKFLKKKLFSKFVKRLESRILINKKYNFRKKIKYTLKLKTKKIKKSNDYYFVKKTINLQKLKDFTSKIGINSSALLKKKNEINLNSKSILIKKIILSSNVSTNYPILKKNEINLNSKKKLKLNITLKYPTIFKKEIKIKAITVFGFGKNKWKYFIKNSKKQNMEKFTSFSPEIKNLSDMLKNVKLKAFSTNNLINFGLKNSIFLKKINSNISSYNKKSLLFQTLGRTFELGILVNPNRNIIRFVNRQKQKNIKKKNIKISKTKLSLTSKIIKQGSQINKKNILKYIRLNWKKKIKIYDFFRKKNNLVPESKIFRKKTKKKAENVGWKIKSRFLMQCVRRNKWQLFLKTSEISQTNNFLSKIRKFNFLKVLKKSKNYKKTIRKNKIFLKKIKRYSRRIFRLSRFSIRRAIRRKLTKLAKFPKIQTNILRSIRRRNKRIFYRGKSKKKKFYRQLKNDKKTKYRVLKKKKLILLQMYKKLPKKIKIGIYQKIKIRNIRKNNNKGMSKVSKKINLRKKSKLYKKITKKLKHVRFKKITSRRYAVNKKWQKIHFSAKFLKKSNNTPKLKNNSKFTNNTLKTTNLNYLVDKTKNLNTFEIAKLKAILPFNFDYYFLKTQNSKVKVPSKLRSFWINKISKLGNTSLLKNYGIKNKVLKKSKNMPKLVKSLIKTVRSNMKSRKALFFKTPKFKGASYLKKNRLTLRLKLKKMFNMRKGCYLKKQNWWIRCRKFRKKWRFKSYFWRKLRKGIKSLIIGGLNDNIWYKKKGKWFEHLRKNSKHRKFKNFWIKERWREYGKRRFPKDWYKVRRRKFPLKSGKKNWSLKITKHYNFFYFRFIRNQTTYDSSYAYFDYLSVLGRHNKKIRNSGKYKLARRTEHLIHFPWEITPNFYKIMGFKKKKNFWNKISSYRNYIYGLSRKGTIDLKSLFTPSADSFGIKKYSLVKNSAFKKSMQVFINSWNNYLDSRFTLFTVSSKLWFAKMNNVLKYTGIQKKKTWSANRIALPFEHAVDLKLSRLKRYNYGLKTTIMIDKLTRVNLNNALVDSYFNFKRPSLVSTYDLASKSNFRVFRAYSLSNYSFTKNKLYRLGYSDFASIFVDNAITTVKISKLYKAYRAIVPQLRTNFDKSGGVCIKRDYFFTKRLNGTRYRVQFIQKIPKFIKKNFWVFNSFEINNSGTFSSNL